MLSRDTAGLLASDKIGERESGSVAVPQADLVAELQLLYRAAGRPSFRRISQEIRDNDAMPDTVSHETVSALLGGTFIPRWSKVECVVRQLAAMAVHRPNVESEVLRFHALWATVDDDSRVGPSVAAIEGRPVVTAPIIPQPRRPAAGDPTGPAEPQTGSVPPRGRNFTGRDDLLGIMRARLAGRPWQPVLLHGLSGVGKTSLAIEYVHRHAEQYDVVWWIVAEQPAQARAALAALGDRLDLPASQDMRQTINTVLGRLDNADFRWLLVFDNAAGSDEIWSLLPAAGGDVIVTTRDATWLDRGRAVQVDVLRREDSIELLSSRGSISFDEADQLADRLGDLPLALEQAAAMRAATGISVAEYLRRLEVGASEVLDEGRPSGYPETVAGAFGVTFEQVRGESTAAAQLLELLSCLSAEPVSLTLLRAADEGVIPPPLGRLLEQEEQLEEAVFLLRRFGLISVVDDGQRLQVHRLVQLIVRDSLTEQERERAYSNARHLLVAANPGNPDESINWEMFAQIGPHIRPAGLVGDTEQIVRWVVLDYARYLYVIGDFDASRRLSEEARAAWAGPHDIWDDEQTFVSLDRLVNALLALGQYREADELLERVWDRLNAHERFGPHHPRTLRTAGVVGLSRRILGRYGEALALERARVEFYEQAGPSSQYNLLLARGNVAVSLRSVGDFAQALDIDEGLVAYETRARGETHYRTLLYASNLAHDLYGLGRYAESLELQEQVLPGLKARLGARHLSVILAGRTVALGLRKAGRLAAAVDESRTNFHACRGELGSDHGHTLAAAMTYANAVRNAVAAGLESGQVSISLAYNLSSDAVNRYRRRFGDRNPLTLAAATNQAAVLRAMGERRRARRTGEPAYHALYQQLGAAHPYAHAAAVGLANDLVAVHEEEEAFRLLSETLNIARDAGREAHPDVLIGAINLGLVMRSSDWDAGQAMVEPNLEALRRAIGAGHPQVVAAEQGQRGECDIEPPPF
jgi:tetratricopeptide (TPR) repeat protein